MIRSLFRLYLARDCSLVEINPLVVTRDGRVLALDAKLNFDDNALCGTRRSSRCATSTRRIRSTSRRRNTA